MFEKNKKVLICQRSATMKHLMKWEFPGGKSESKEDCLQREVKEELGMIITIDRALKPVEHQYPDFSICTYPLLAANGNLVK